MKRILGPALVIVLSASGFAESKSPEHWLSLYSGEEMSIGAVVSDLAKTDVIYVGEIHSDVRHHEIQASLLAALCDQKVPLVLGLEQIEARHQASVDRFNRRELDFDGLAKAIDWVKQWKNFEQYRELCQTAQKHNVPLRALNAPAEIIRAIGKGGLSSLGEAERRQVADEIITDDPVYQDTVQRMLNGHGSMTPEKLQTFFEAQVTRDETMAANISQAMTDETGARRVVFVVCGRGHVSYGLGTASRTLRRAPNARQKIVHITDSRSTRTRKPSGLNASHAPKPETAPARTPDRPVADYLCFRPGEKKAEKRGQ